MTWVTVTKLNTINSGQINGCKLEEKEKQFGLFFTSYFSFSFPSSLSIFLWSKNKVCVLFQLPSCARGGWHHYRHLILMSLLHQSSPLSSNKKKKHQFVFRCPRSSSSSSLFFFFASLPLTPARSLPRLPPPSPKSSEGHPGARRVAVMSANEPIDNLSTGWLVLQALTMCFTENFLARNHSLLDPRPAMPSAWA